MLTYRKLTQSEARTLHEELKTTPNILGYTVKELEKFGDVYVWENEKNQLAGLCVSKDLRFNWTDIAVLYVLPKARGQGIGRKLFDAAWERAERRNRHIVALSRSPEVLTWMRKRGLTPSRSFRKIPLALHLHMQCHMASLYRNREALRKRFALKTSESLHVVTQKSLNYNPSNPQTKI